MTELQGAVGIAQLDKVEWICSRRNEIGDRITKAISGLKGIYPPKVHQWNKSSYWFYMMRIDKNEARVDAETFAEALMPRIPVTRLYPDLRLRVPLFVEKNAYPPTHAPFDSKYYGREISYHKGLCPVAEQILETAVKFSINEFYSDSDVEDIIAAIRKVYDWYQRQGK